MEELAPKWPLVDVVDVVEGVLDVPDIYCKGLDGFLYKNAYI